MSSLSGVARIMHKSPTLRRLASSTDNFVSSHKSWLNEFDKVAFHLTGIRTVVDNLERLDIDADFSSVDHQAIELHF